MVLTVKDFAKTLKISDSALLERMQNAGLSHSKNTDEVTAADKQALLKSLKSAKATPSKSITSGSGVTVTSKGKTSKDTETVKSYSDNIEAKRAAAIDGNPLSPDPNSEHPAHPGAGKGTNAASTAPAQSESPAESSRGTGDTR